MNEEREQLTAELVSGSFDLEKTDPDHVKEALSRKIGELLQNNPVLLRSIFYRIDLNESQLGIALSTMSGTELCDELAEQVIERMRRKAETRIKYGGR